MPNPFQYTSVALDAQLPLVPIGGLMATISQSNAQALCDSIAKHVITAIAVPGAVSALQTGQGTTLGKIAALNDASQQYFLLDGFEQMMNAESAWITMIQLYNSVLDFCFTGCQTLDNATGGLAAFIANSFQVDPHFLDAFNRAFMRGAGSPKALLQAYQAFGADIANMAQLNVTGSGIGTYVQGASQAAAYGNAPLSIFNANGSNVGAANCVVTVTYNSYNGSGVLQTGLTATATLPSGSVPNAAVSLAVSGVAVTNMTLTGGTNGDKVGVSCALLRAVAF